LETKNFHLVYKLQLIRKTTRADWHKKGTGLLPQLQPNPMHTNVFLSLVHPEIGILVPTSA